MPFENRWQITGTLTTRTPFHCGNGDIVMRPELLNEQTNQPVEIKGVATDSNNRAVIPGSTLKGNLRAWAKAAQIAAWEQIFGSEDAAQANAVGGKAEFYDARVCDTAWEFDQEPPYWNPTRCTGVSAAVTINRRTRTASTQRLFHHEFVPPGVSFAVTITGQNLSEGEIVALLGLLQAFDSDAITVGASNGDGWGQMSWELTSLKRLTAAQVGNWMQQPVPAVGYAALEEIPEAEKQNLLEQVVAQSLTPPASAELALDIQLNFLSHFLVNDPSRTGAVAEGRAAHTALRDTQGYLLLPASSFRGAFRSQAEKILRTLHGTKAACYPESPCEAVYAKEDLAHLCPACLLFGAAGWRSPLTITPFKTAAPVTELLTQEFVAIDRFTGGGSDGAKFNAEAAWQPTLSGQVKVNLAALAWADIGRWALGLLTLTFRDLLEGDIRFGFGAAKGYGEVVADIRLAQSPSWESCPEIYRADLRAEQFDLARLNAWTDDDLKTAMQFWVMELRDLPIPPTAKGVAQ